MVKYSSIMISLVLFGAFITLMFSSAATLGNDYNSRDHGNYSQLAGEYEQYVTSGSEVNSTLRTIKDKLGGETSSISVGADILTAAVDGVKLFFNSIPVLIKASNQIQDDTGGRINPIFGQVLASILTIVFVVIVISMLMRFKPET